MQETQVQSLGQDDPLEKEMATHQVFLPGEFHGQRSLVGCNPQGHKELDTTECLTLSFFIYIFFSALSELFLDLNYFSYTYCFLKCPFLINLESILRIRPLKGIAFY